MKNKLSTVLLLSGLIGCNVYAGESSDQSTKSEGKGFYNGTQKPESTPEKEEKPCLEPFGIKIGKTTIEELKKRFTLLSRETTKLGRVYRFDPKNFNIGDLRAKEVFVFTVSGENEDIIENIEISLCGKYFSKLKEILSQKYYIDEIKERFVGDNTCRFKDPEILDQWIFLQELHMSFDTTLVYRSSKFENAREDLLKKIEQKNDADMENKL